MLSGLAADGLRARVGAVAIRGPRPVSRWWVAALLVALAATLRAAWLVVGGQREPIVLGTDSYWYELLGWNLLQGRGLSLAQEAPFTPTMYREPGYAAFVAAIYALVGRAPEAVSLVQALLLGASVVLVAVVGRRVFGATAGLLGALLVAVSPDQADVARQVLSETPFVFLVLLALLVALRARQSNRLRDFALVGLLFGLATLLRVQAQVILLLALPGWLLLDRLQLGRWRVKQLAVVLAVATLVVLPWMVRNQAQFGQLSLSQRYGAALLPRGVRATVSPQQHLRWAGQAAWVALNPWSALVYPLERFQYDKPYWQNDIWDFHLTYSTKAVVWGAEACEAVAARGEQALDQYLRQLPLPARGPVELNTWHAGLEPCGLALGLRLIRENPVAYMVQMPLEWVKLNFYPLPSRLSAFRNTLTWAAYLTFAWLLVRGRLRGEVAWLAVLVGAMNAQAMLADPAERYAVPILPLYYLFAAAGLVGVAVWARDRLGQSGEQGRTVGAAHGR